jgi:hypothetical protein
MFCEREKWKNAYQSLQEFHILAQVGVEGHLQVADFLSESPREAQMSQSLNDSTMMSNWIGFLGTRARSHLTKRTK